MASSKITKKIHINGQYIKDNQDLYDRDPDRPLHAVLTVWREGERNISGTEVAILGPSQIIYNPLNPIPYNGRRVSLWVETNEIVLVRVDGKWEKIP